MSAWTPAGTTDTTVGLWSRPRAGVLWGGVWLVYLVPAFVEAVGGDRSPAARVVGVVLLLAFVAGYIATMATAWGVDEQWGGRPRNRWDTPLDEKRIRLGLAVIALSVASVAVVGEQGVATFVFLAPVASSLLPGRRAPTGIVAAMVLVVVGELVARRYGTDQVDAAGVLSSAFAAAMAGFITLGVRRMRLVMWELAVARQDASRLASAEERVRIARDLHDVLGHSLTVISVRSQLAARLVERDEMQRAGEEIRAVESLTRTAMADVREAVAGYRVRPFAAELAAAEATLESAGITVEVERSEEQLPPAGEEALAFVLREGVTNVLRHSSARHCAIGLHHTDATVVLELADDGRGAGVALHVVDPAVANGGAPMAPAAGAPADGAGSGLRGLAERLAAAGGGLTAGDTPGGGFVLRAEVGR